MHSQYNEDIGLALGGQLGEPVREDVLTALLQKQAPSGGFDTLYRSDGTIAGDTNTETTAYALLTLQALGCHVTYLPNLSR